MQIQISQEKLNQEIVAHLLDYFSDAQIDGLKIQLSEAQLLADLIVGDILRQRQARLEIDER